MREKYKIIPVRGGSTIVKKTFFGYKPFMIHDISPGHGGDEIWPMVGTKSDCEKVLRFLKYYCKFDDLHVNWKIMERIKSQLGIKFFYLKDFKY